MGITELRSRRPPRTAFVPGGGGNLGAVQVGMLRALVDRGITPDLVLGCRVGAINGVGLAMSPDFDGVDLLERTWLDPAAAAGAELVVLPGVDHGALRRNDFSRSGELIERARHAAGAHLDGLSAVTSA